MRGKARWGQDARLDPSAFVSDSTIGAPGELAGGVVGPGLGACGAVGILLGNLATCAVVAVLNGVGQSGGAGRGRGGDRESARLAKQMLLN